MHFIYNVILNSSIKTGNFYFLARFIGSSAVIYSDDSLEIDDKPKEKITVVRRKFHHDKQTTSILEWRSAADVMKRLNWENANLFGPVLTSKTKPCSSKIDSNIIQHETRIPIFESLDACEVQQNKEKQKVDLCSILTFPLINKIIHSKEKINELNYLRKHLEILTENSSLPSVTSILQKTMPVERLKILDKWRLNMICQLGKEGFEKYQAELFSNGSSLHHSISCYLSSTPECELYIKEENVGHWKSLKHIFPTIKDVKLLEEFVTHPFLCYRGVVDCFAKYKDHLVVIDWKTSKKVKSLIKNTYDDPLQIAAYVGALNFDPKFQYLANKGLLVIAYETGHPSTAHFIDQTNMKFYWQEWLKRIKKFWEVKELEKKCS